MTTMTPAPLARVGALLLPIDSMGTRIMMQQAANTPAFQVHA
ncbi:MAG: hypothetical protein V9G16_11275 [Nitrosomonas sp.]